MTVIIVGAGASKDFHSEMGTGTDLIKDIQNRVNENHLPNNERYLTLLLEKLNENSNKIKNEELRKLIEKYKDDKESLFKNFHEKLSSYLEKNKGSGSIDEFVNSAKDYLSLAKFLIGFHIMGYEGTSKNGFETNNKWLYHLASKLEG